MKPLLRVVPRRSWLTDVRDVFSPIFRDVNRRAFWRGFRVGVLAGVVALSLLVFLYQRSV